MALFILCFLAPALASNLVEYRPGVNFGNVFYDYSGNGMSGVSGTSSADTTNNLICTDRGAYFSGATKVLTFPSNNIATTALLLPSTYAIIFWVNIMAYNSAYLYYSSQTGSNNLIYLQTGATPNLLIVQVKITGTSLTSTPFSIPAPTSWNFIAFTYGPTAGSVISGNNVVAYTFTQPVANYAESGTFVRTIGGNENGFQGFLWYVAIVNTVTTVGNYVTATSNNCLTSACTVGCTPAWVDPYMETGCVSTHTETNQDASGAPCPPPPLPPNTSCSGNVQLICTCTNLSCELSGTAITCACTTNQYISGSGGCTACVSPCLACSSASTCVSCVAANASPIGNSGCICNSGFWGAAPLMNANSCTACYSECSTCTEANKCRACIASNAIPNTSTNIGCVCVSGYWGTSLLTSVSSCVACSADCSGCSQTTGICTTCIATYAIPNSSVSGCICNTGYVGSSPLSTPTSCILGNLECATSYQITASCLTCIAAHAIPNSNTGSGCLCNTGYFGASPLTSSTSCTLCNSDCSTCDQTTGFCTLCVSTNATPTSGTGSSAGCVCNTGYTKTSPTICSQCNAVCSSCTSVDTCETCTDPNAVPDTSSNIGCICDLGYWKSGSTCVPCFGECATCTAASICSACISTNAEPLLTGGCACTSGFTNSTELTAADSCVTSVITCDTSCKSCSGPYSYQCTSCNLTYFYGFCLDNCPMGYLGNATNCTAPASSQLILEFNFEGTGQVYYDKANSIAGYLEHPGRSRALTESVYGRGMYFDGSGYLRINSTALALFSPQFSLSFWMNTNITEGVVFYKGNATAHVLSVYLNASCIALGLTINNTEISYTAPGALLIQEWNHVLVTINYSLVTTLQIAVNGVSAAVQEFSAVPFIDVASLDLLIAYNSTVCTYVGFLYLIELFVPSVGLADVISSSCEVCALCPIGGICIPNCAANAYYSETTKTCTDCPASCTSCLNSSSCSLCMDSNCISCSAFSINSCTACAHGYQLQNSNCVICTGTQYYDSGSTLCMTCQGLCISCSSVSSCTSCMENSSLQSDNSCLCNTGYAGTVSCERNYFTAVISVFVNNTFQITFSEPLLTSLDSSTLQVQVSSSPYEFTVSPIDSSNYLVTITSLPSLSKKAPLTVTFVGEILSINNSLLATTTLQSTLLVDSNTASQIEIQVQAQAAKSTAKTGTTVGLSAVFGISVLNFDPTSFCNFMSTAELFYSAYLINTEIYPVLSEFLVGMRIESSMPNIFSYFISENKGSAMPEKQGNYGYKTNLLTLNVGVRFSVLAIFIIIGFTLNVLTKNPWLSSKFNGMLDMFKYGVFLRFWVQLFFEILMASSLGMSYYNFTSAVQSFDFILACLLMVRTK